MQIRLYALAVGQISKKGLFSINGIANQTPVEKRWTKSRLAMAGYKKGPPPKMNILSGGPFLF